MGSGWAPRECTECPGMASEADFRTLHTSTFATLVAGSPLAVGGRELCPEVSPCRARAGLGSCRSLMSTQPGKNISGGRVDVFREELGEPLSGGGSCHIVLTLRPEKESGFSSTCLPLSCRRVTSQGREVPAGTGSRVASHSCAACLLYSSGDAFHVELRLRSHSGCNPCILAWQPCQGEEASVSLEGKASIWACSSEGQPRQLPGYNPLSSGSPCWHLSSNGHGQPVFKFFWEKTCGFDVG